MIPKTLLAVEGWARTLICVDAVPSTGATVGCGGTGSGACEGEDVGDAGSVDVANGGVAVVPLSSPEGDVQLVMRIKKIEKTILRITGKTLFRWHRENI
jgi:hypothetical protein